MRSGKKKKVLGLAFFKPLISYIHFLEIKGLEKAF